MKHIFYEANQLSALIIGDIAQDEDFVGLARNICKSLHVSVSAPQIQKMVLESKIDLIFGTLSCQGVSYLKVLQEIKQINPKMEVILFLKVADVDYLYDALALKCSRYLYMKEEEEHLFKHFKDGLDVISHKDIFLKDTQYFNVLIESSVVSQSDIKGNVTYINDNFTKVTGYTKEEILGKNHRILRHPANGPEIFKDMWGTITQGKVWRERVLNKNKDGSDFWADTIIIPFKDEKSGEIIQYIAIRRDITQMLEERRAIQAREIKANEQTKLSEAKDSFLILFTHELKTPLNAIINFSQYLYKNMHRIEEIPKEKRIHLLEQIYKSASMMLENVTSILDLSKLRNHKINYTYTLFNLKESIQDVIDKHEALALENKKEIVFQDDGSESYISSDEFRFKQIIANILSNAIKYGNSSVEVFLLSDKDKIEIIVEDDGKGISDKEGVFELYEQSAGGNTNMEKKGTGIGLNFVKLLCADLGFSCVIEDSLSLGGAKFIVTKKLKD
ncbi:PAS domain-containing protein [Sulfurospirillum diekertiae]|uniref:PAS domain-containing sensor histidine kinase n=1 Tax=Sulfurospirillum diekertiae TaxID=1854492 RepID=UPI0014277EB8|nr:HAMP domain-containing sensor histidine kinase [Sulfurospirillum diekertiae]QIR78266.1 PAS domain-containing protein [Sulfurospirillum diekertiae]